MGASEEIRGRRSAEKKREAPFSLQEVRDEYLFLVPQEAWAYKPLSLGGLLRLLRIVGPLLEGAGDYQEAIGDVTEEMITEIVSFLTWQPMEAIERDWDFPSALQAVLAFWRSPEFEYLSSPPEQKELEEPEEMIAWLTSIIERLSRSRGWTADYILGLPFLAVLKLLEALDEREWDERTEMIISVERGVARAVASALGKGDSLPDLPTYRETKRRLKEAEAIKEKGRRFFEAAMK